jgi:methionyl-tRNA formyltransferase
MLGRYNERYAAFPEAPLLQVSDVNAAEVKELVKRERPDLVIVSGTNLLKEPLIRAILASGKVMNLHTGISPYVKGAPNCTNWCLAIGRFDLIGNTIMWLDSGIDSGNLIATERTPLDGSESLLDLHIKVMEHGHDLYLRCIARFVAGYRLPDVPQGQIGPGSLYLTKDWTPRRILRAVWNYHFTYWRKAGAPPREPLVLIRPD